jgi:small subunit ribosomal protein S20
MAVLALLERGQRVRDLARDLAGDIARARHAADCPNGSRWGSCWGAGFDELLPSRSPPASGRSLDMANIKQQKKRVRIQERQRGENLRYRSTIKTLTKRLESAVADGNDELIASEHRTLVRTIDRAASRGALHANTAARKKSQAAKIVATQAAS